ncbi:hypothetical protein SISSUDRAFT_1059657 [Sistotremastrum suecicum HHB10207 ss-3]|uniref:Uncharacterized protein n=1 Tax=Sistotremastrum suecicum HHB10207 ss-3 TaxID=1314776 RepID=A0A166G541_9AGAM|nr:hypothetical protein SISSUDRAFT_1059657 [Sistotremastrum suecicum HHB10207 ss-3]
MLLSSALTKPDRSDITPSPPPPIPPAVVVPETAKSAPDGATTRPKSRGGRKSKEDEPFVPSSAKTPRNTCGKEWIQNNPQGTVRQFTEHWNALSPEQRHEYTKAGQKNKLSAQKS